MAKKFFGGVKPDVIETRKSISCWLNQQEVFLEEDIDDTFETDVIVCGAGIAGVSAARAAAEAGARVIVLEKSKAPSGRSGQFAVIGGETIKKWGVDNTSQKNEMVNDLMRESSYRADQRILKYFADHIGADFDWYISGAKEPLYIQKEADEPVPVDKKIFMTLMQHPVQPFYDRSTERFPCYPCTIQIRPGHLPVLKDNMERAMMTGKVQAFYSMPAKKLLGDEKQGVTGVIAKGFDGRTIRIWAKAGVVLATGDYSGDRKMLAYYCPWLNEHAILPYGLDEKHQALNFGDGHKMGLRFGAKMEEEPHGGMAHNMGAAIGVAPFLLLDVDGNRFMNEDCPGEKLENRLSRMKQKIAWQIFDAGWKEEIPYMPLGHSSPSRVLDMERVKAGKAFFDLTPMDGFAAEWFIEAMQEEGRTVTADSLEELTEKMGLPRENTLASIARYNQLADQGYDEDFGKRSDRLFALKKPPYYASRIEQSFLLGTISGLESDDMAHVLNQSLDVIPGLYAAGNVQGNRFGCEYPTTMPGLSHSMALCFGRRAGQNAAGRK